MSEPPAIRVHFLPQFVAEHELAGSTVVVVDLLRASTTICHALAAGAREVVPFVEVGDAVRAAAAQDRADIVLGGERNGLPIEGFDLGNSPAEYTADVVFGRRVLFTTTNGTRALEHARLAERVLVGALVNLSAVVDTLQQVPRIDIVCAGTGGHVTREDILAGGALVHALDAARTSRDYNESSERARAEWEELLTSATAARRTVVEQVACELRDTPGGRNLTAIGLDDDLIACSQIDALDVVPQLDARDWRIHVP